jgi:hypothetical protein
MRCENAPKTKKEREEKPAADSGDVIRIDLWMKLLRRR